MDSHRVNKSYLLRDHSLEVHKGNNKTFNSTRSIGGNSLNILSKRDNRSSKGMKFGFSSSGAPNPKGNKITQFGGKGVNKFINSRKRKSLELHVLDDTRRGGGGGGGRAPLAHDEKKQAEASALFF